MLLDKAIERNKKATNRLEQTAEWAKDHNFNRFNDLAFDIDIYEDRVSIEIFPEQLKGARKLLGKGWKLTGTIISDAGHRFHNYQHKEELKTETWPRELTLMETVVIDKTQCKRVQTGIKEVPVYEIVCQ